MPRRTQAARSRVEPNTTSILHYAWHKRISPETENPQVRHTPGLPCLLLAAAAGGVGTGHACNLPAGPCLRPACLVADVAANHRLGAAWSCTPLQLALPGSTCLPHPPTPAALPPTSVASHCSAPQGYLLDGAAGQLAELLTAALPEDAVRLSEPVIKLARTPDGVVATTLEGEYEARAVIVATPPHLAGRIQYEPAMDPLRSQLTMNAPLVGAHTYPLLGTQVAT